MIDEILIMKMDGTPLLYNTLNKKRLNKEFLSGFLCALQILSSTVYGEDRLEYISFRNTIGLIDSGEFIQVFVRFNKSKSIKKVQAKLKQVIDLFEREYRDKISKNIVELSDFAFFYRQIYDIFEIKVSEAQNLINELEALNINADKLNLVQLLHEHKLEDAKYEPYLEDKKNALKPFVNNAKESDN
ncbi:MAG: hypothetical protein ACTSWN_10200 [Promethearchaeota archaeon]